MKRIDDTNVYVGRGAGAVVIPVRYAVGGDRLSVDYWLSATLGGAAALPALRRRVWVMRDQEPPTYAPYRSDLLRAFPALAQGRPVRAFLVVGYAGVAVASGVVQLMP